MGSPLRPIVEAGWLAVLALTPVFVNPWSGQALEPAKAAAVRLLVLCMLGGWLWSAPRGVRAHRGLMILVVGGLAAQALSTITSIAPAVSLFGGRERGQGLLTMAAYAMLLWLVGAGLTRRVQRERAVTVILIASVPVALYAIIQRFGLDPFAPPVTRPGSTLGGPIFLGAYLLMAAPLALARALEGMRRGRLRPAGIAVHAAVFALQSAALLFALSRGPFLGFVAALLTLALLDVRMGGARRAAPWMAVCCVALLLTLGVGRSFARLVQPGGGTSRVRVLIWEATMRLAGPHGPLLSPVRGADRLNPIRPLVGYGPESLSTALGPFHPDELARLETRRKPDRAHNVLLDALATTGMLGAIAYLALVTGILAVGLIRLGAIRPDGVSRFVAWCAAGAASAAVLATMLLGAGWLAPAVGWGLIGGTLAFLAFERGSPGTDDIVTAAVLAAVVGHVVETQVGIATTTTSAHAAFLAGMLAAPEHRDTPDEADRTALYGVITGVVLGALVFAFPAVDRWWAPGMVVLTGGTAVAAWLLASTEDGSSVRDAVWFAVVALTAPVALALPQSRLLQRAAAGAAEAPVYMVLLFVAFAALAVWLAARALHGECRPRAPRPSSLALAGAALVLLVAAIEVGRLAGAVLAQAALRSGDAVERRIIVLERARRLQPFDAHAEAMLGAAYLSLAERGLPQHALARAEEALLHAQWLDPFNASYSLDLARLQRAAARLLPAQAGARVGQAVGYYEAAARLDPTALDVHLERAAALSEHARILARSGDPDAADEAQRQAQKARDRAGTLQPTSAYSEAID